MSVSINVDLSGAEEFSQALNRFDAAMQNRVQQQLLDWAESVKADAERLVPVRTGYLQSTIFAKSQGGRLRLALKLLTLRQSSLAQFTLGQNLT